MKYTKLVIFGLLIAVAFYAYNGYLIGKGARQVFEGLSVEDRLSRALGEKE